MTITKSTVRILPARDPSPDEGRCQDLLFVRAALMICTSLGYHGNQLITVTVKPQDRDDTMSRNLGNSISLDCSLLETVERG
ncbi:Hypothetical protein NTJ_03465 [Nesidiocoris tenuis]|uniref:Uncharacterized protein n=1 Tax=Nesidiocoris tenuis TaxID=355587 RepID=A0ABN7AEG2_9HEMI|nr:Hypothetical protein NTJ_03465 [Nesidiocoris tenuis]